MDGIAKPAVGSSAVPDPGSAAAGERTQDPATLELDAAMAVSGQPVADGPEGGQGASPSLTLTGFIGPLDHLLALARAQHIDLSLISLTALAEQLAAALRLASGTISLAQQGDWVVMAAWLVQLRSRLLLPADTPAHHAAAADADALRARLVALAAVQALAGWLARRPQLGQEVFARGRPEMVGVSIAPTPVLNVVAFLWASLALFDDTPATDTTTVYRPVQCDLHAAADARDRILRLLAEMPGGAPFERLLPALSDAPEASPACVVRRRSAWSSTFSASLELARQGTVALAQAGDFQAIHVAPA